MALKFLNKKGWHTGSLRNIENVWKAEQKHDAEQKKLEELRKQIQEERERSEFRLLQEQAGLVPRQERLDFLYDSGLAVGKGSSDGFKALETFPKTETEANSSSSKQSSTPGALFEEKPQSANDSWRKLHSDPLLLIRQREQEALARVKNNPVQMAMIRKSVEVKQQRSDKKEHKKHRHKTSKHDNHKLSKGQSDSEGATIAGKERSKGSHSSYLKHEKHSSRDRSGSETDASEREGRRKRSHHKLKHENHSSRDRSDSETDASEREGRRKRSHHKLKHENHSSRDRSDSETDASERERRRKRSHHRLKHENHSYGRLYAEADTSKREERSERRRHKSKHEKHSTETLHTTIDASTPEHSRRPPRRPQQSVSKLSEEEKAARLREMQLDAELHEEQRWKRLKKAADEDTQEANQVRTLGGRSFLDDAQKRVYGAEKGGSSTIEESVRRRTYYLQGRSDAGEGNAFRR